MQQPGFSLRGAVDLSSLAAPRPPAGAPAAAPGAGGFVVDVTEASFEADVIAMSDRVPVVIDLWAEWCEPCKALSPVLEKLAEADGGRWLLAKIDIDANPRIAQAFQVQSIPAVFAVLMGRPLPLFQGALPERDVRAVIDELLRAAEANGVTGRLAPAEEPAEGEAAAAPEEPPLDPDLQAAYDAIDRGDYDASAAAFRRRLGQAPADAEAQVGLAQVELMRRIDGVDPAAARAAAAERPTDVDAQRLAADLDLAEGDVDVAFRRLVETVRLTSGVERDAARQHLLELFTLVGNDDARVVSARLALANALF